MKNFTITLLLALLVATGVTANEPINKVTTEHDIHILTVDNMDGKITTKTIESVFEKAGFFINDNRDMVAPFKKNFKEVDFEVYNLFTVFQKDAVLKLAQKYPKIGLFSPMSMSIYTRKGTKKLSVSFLSSAAMAKIMDIPVDDVDMISYGKLVEETLHKALPNAKEENVSYHMQDLKGPLVQTATLKMEEDADWEDVKDDFEMNFEGELAPAKFIMAGFNDLNYDFEEAKYEAFTFYDVYSICNIEVIYTVSKLHPEAGAFAPCSLYMYNKKDTNTIEMGFPTVYKWLAAMDIKDKASVDILMFAQTKMEEILGKLTGSTKTEIKKEKAVKKCATGKCGQGKCGGK
jgi:uncharacterized protein (DUF302 family)